jgi:small-conductance mechanosensitive channel
MAAQTWSLVLSLGLVGFGAGCASSSNSSTAPKPGRGIAEYREVVGVARQAVAATVTSLEALVQPSPQPLSKHPALPGFDEAFYRLELTSVKARSRAEAIIARGQAYFDEWKANLSLATNSATTQAESERYARWHEHFERVRERSGEVREEFRPFMAKLREFRARLDQPGAAAASDASRQELDGLIVSGRRVLQTLDGVSTALNDAQAEVSATRTATR